MMKNSLTFYARMVYCFLPEDYWWKQLLFDLGVGLIMTLLLSLF